MKSLKKLRRLYILESEKKLILNGLVKQFSGFSGFIEERQIIFRLYKYVRIFRDYKFEHGMTKYNFICLYVTGY